MAQGPSALEVTVKEALLWFRSSSPSPRRQRRVGAGRAWEEQVHCSASPSQEQEGLSGRGGVWGEGGEGVSAAPAPQAPVSCPQESPHSQTTERCRETCWEPSEF